MSASGGKVSLTVGVSSLEFWLLKVKGLNLAASRLLDFGKKLTLILV